MLILVHTAHPQAVAHAGAGFGRLLSPGQYARAADTAGFGIPWAADNYCFERPIATKEERAYKQLVLEPNAERFRAMLAAISGLPGCLFVVAPDRVADATTTFNLFREWLPEMKATGQPIAFVIQDGLTVWGWLDWQLPWDDFDCLFIGGSTEFKLGLYAEKAARMAKERGKWVHMGRVNSRKRFDYARAIGCDSVDGTKFSRWRDRWLPDALTWHRDHLQERIAA